MIEQNYISHLVEHFDLSIASSASTGLTSPSLFPYPQYAHHKLGDSSPSGSAPTTMRPDPKSSTWIE